LVSIAPSTLQGALHKSPQKFFVTFSPAPHTHPHSAADTQQFKSFYSFPGDVMNQTQRANTMRNIPASHHLPTLVGIAFAVIYVPLVANNSTLRSAIRALDPGSARLWSLALLEWFPAGVIVLIVLAWERRTMGSIGIRPLRLLDLRWALRGVGITGLMFWLTGALLAKLGLTSVDAELANLARLPIWLRLIVALSAGVCEELIYRGFLIERLTALTGNLRLASFVSYITSCVKKHLRHGHSKRLNING
jgi:membrane protease YdiL (CAAX protease family)